VSRYGGSGELCADGKDDTSCIEFTSFIWKAPKLGCVRLKYVKLEEVWLLRCSSDVCVPNSCVMVLPLQSLKMPEVIVSSFSC
jgi:hypothetical protein